MQFGGKKSRSSVDNGAVRVQDIFRDYSHKAAQHDPSEYTTESGAQTLDAEPSTSHAADASSSTAGPSKLVTANVGTTPSPADAPPSYSKLLEEEREKVGLAEVAKWHSGRETTEALPQGVSSDVIAEWKRVKEELGFSCLAIDEVIAKSEVTGPRPGSVPTPPIAKAVEKKADEPEGESLGSLKWTTILGIAGAFCAVSCK